MRVPIRAVLALAATGWRGEAQMSVAAAWSTETNRGRVIAQRSVDRDVAKVRQLIAEVESATKPSGLPKRLLNDVRVTINLADDVDDNVEERVHPDLILGLVGDVVLEVQYETDGSPRPAAWQVELNLYM